MINYAACIKEKYGFDCYFDDDGFFTWSTVGCFFVQEFYISPTSRIYHKSYSKFLKMMYEKALEAGYNEVFISIYMKAKNDLKENTLMLALREGFILSSSSADHIILKKGC